MSEETESTGDQIAGAAAPVDNVQSEPQVGAESQEGTTVPLGALQAEREQRQGLQEELRVIKDHLGLLQAQQSQAAQQPAKDDMDALSDDDVLTVGEAKKFLSKMSKQHQMSIEELKITQKHPDYSDVVTKYLPEVLKQNPGLRKTLQDSQDYELAYYLASKSDDYKADHKKNRKSADAERIVQNAQQPGSLSSVGSTTPMNQAKHYRDMSDSDFRQQVARNMGAF